MADAKECDLCGKLYKDREIKGKGTILLGKVNGDDDTEELDLCPSCELELKKWFDSHKKHIL